MELHIKQLSGADRPALEAHFLALGPEDRRLRFGVPLSDDGVHAYVERMNFEHDAVFGVIGDEMQLHGAAHLARSEGHAELGVSVLPAHRGRGIGGALLARAHTHTRNWGIRALFMHCLSENGAMMHLARVQNMQIVAESGEADAWLKLAPADAASRSGEVSEQRVALLDCALKSKAAAARRDRIAVPAASAGARG